MSVYCFFVDEELDIWLYGVVDHPCQVSVELARTAGDLKGMHINAVEVIEERAIEASEHEEVPADEGTWVSASRGGAVGAVEEGPVKGVRVEVMELVEIIRVSASEDEHSLVIDRRGMPPSGRGLISSSPENFRRDLDACRVEQELLKVQLDYSAMILKLIIIWASSKEVNFVSDSRGCVEPSCFEAQALELKLDPYSVDQVQSPQVIKVYLSFPSDHYHVLVY